MMFRGIARWCTSIVLILGIAGCGAGAGGLTNKPPEDPDKALGFYSTLMQKTVLEATAISGWVSAGSGVIGGKGGGTNFLYIGIPIGFATGTYVGFLQQQYANDEERLEVLTTDIEANNGEIEAAIQTMQQVLARQRSDLAAARAAGGTAVAREEAETQQKLASMQTIISGAEAREREFGETRRLNLVEGQETGVDQQLQELRLRIATMREIANNMTEIL